MYHNRFHSPRENKSHKISNPKRTAQDGPPVTKIRRWKQKTDRNIICVCTNLQEIEAFSHPGGTIVGFPPAASTTPRHPQGCGDSGKGPTHTNVSTKKTRTTYPVAAGLHQRTWQTKTAEGTRLRKQRGKTYCCRKRTTTPDLLLVPTTFTGDLGQMHALILGLPLFPCFREPYAKKHQCWILSKYMSFTKRSATQNKSRVVRKLSETYAPRSQQCVIAHI